MKYTLKTMPHGDYHITSGEGRSLVVHCKAHGETNARMILTALESFGAMRSALDRLSDWASGHGVPQELMVAAVCALALADGESKS